MHEYMPILRLNRAECRALRQLTSEQRDRILPLVEVPSVRLPLDGPESKLPLEVGLDKHAGELDRSLAGRAALIDLRLLDATWRDSHNRTAIEILFDAQGLFRRFVPVTGVGREPEYDAAVREVVHHDHLGLGLRLTAKDLTGANYAALVSPMCRIMRCPVEQIDLVADFARISGDNGFEGLRSSPLLALPWRSVTVAGGTFPAPAEVRKLPVGQHRLIRGEARAWRVLAERSDTSGPVAFGDYNIDHPVYEPPPKMCVPSASIRYTTQDGWLFIKGASIANADFDGANQWPAYAAALCDLPEFRGPLFSPGDAYIFGKASGEGGTGNPSTWRQAGVSHHISLVLDQLARDREAATATAPATSSTT